MDKNINSNGYEYVDLGLPSGTLWAACNVGADKPADYGLYFQWGDTKGCSKEQIGTGDGKKEFAFDDYKWSIDGSDRNFIKYSTKGAKLDLEDDAAHVNMGGDWHMPTPTQIQELIDNTTTAWITSNGTGITFTSKIDTSKSIFIPAAGYASNGSLYLSGSYGGLWSDMLSTNPVSYGQYLYFTSSYVYLSYYGSRYPWFSVRGVIG